jgi:DNA repair protein RadC
MGKLITTYRLECIKEKASIYDVAPKIEQPRDLHKAFEAVFLMSKQSEEVLVMIALTTKNTICGAFEVSRGTLNASIVHPREVFKRALLVNAASVAIAHNHPSGDPTPSPEDISLTKRIKEVGKILGVELLDHIIIGDDNYVSLKERGIL